MAIPSGTESIRAFVPAQDFAVAKAFYEKLGFEKLSDGEVAIFRCGNCEFILQQFYVKDHAGNFMMSLMVDDVDAWWAHIEALDPPATFDVPKPKAPELMPWGLRVAYLVDPTGVLWHVAERREDKPHDQPRST